jgi:TonB family protein
MSASRLPLLALALALPLAAQAAEEAASEESQNAAKRAGEAGFETKAQHSIEASDLSKQPKLVKQAKVKYPEQAVGKAGDVEIVLAVDLDDTGAVTGAAVLEPKTPTGLGFEEEALAAAYDLGFEPAESAGKPTPVQIIYKFKFLTPPPPKPAAAAPLPIDGGVVEAPKPPPVENFVGALVERGTRLPLAGILITVYRTEVDGGVPLGLEAHTDEKGAFRFFDLAPGEWKVRIEPPSYYPFRTTEEIVAGERTQTTYYLERGSYNPFDVVVEAKRERKEVSRTVIESAVIEKIPGAMGDALAVVQNFAGVARAQAGSGFVMVRGSAPYDTAFFFDGALVPVMYHFGGIRSVLPTGMIDSLQFYPGNFSPYYSWVTGGIIDVDIKKLKPKKVGGYADINLLDGGFYLEIPLGSKAAVAVAGRRSYVDYIINAVLPDDAPINAIQLPRYYDFQVLANYRPTPAHDLRLFFFGSDDRFEVILKKPAELVNELSGNQLQFSTTFYRALATWKYIPNDRFENTIRLSQGRDIQVTQFFNWTMNYTMDMTHLRDTARYQAWKSLALVGGLDVLYARVDGLFNLPAPPSEGQEVEDFDFGDVLHQELKGVHYYAPGFFVELEWKPIKGLLLLPSLRLDYFSEVSQLTAAPRFTMRYELGPQLTVKGGVGAFYQQPQIWEADAVFGSTNLTCMRAIHYSAGVEWKPLKHITFDATGFYKDLSSVVSPNPAFGVDPAAQRYDNNGKGRAYGIELVAKHDLTRKFTGWLAYTLMRSERKDSGGESWRRFQYDQTHLLTILGTYRLPRNWQIGSRFRYYTGNPTTPLTGSTFNSTNDRYMPVYGSTYSSRVPAFHQLDIRLDKLWVYNKWMFNAYVDLQNVYNRENPEQMQYNYNYQRATIRQGFPIYPIIGLRGEF